MKSNNEELKITLNSGRVVTVDAFVFEQTFDQPFNNYGEVETMEESITRARLRVMRLYGEPHHHLIEPDLTGGKSLPDYCLTVWLSSAAIPGYRCAKSGLVVFFTDYVNGIAIDRLLSKHLAGLDWNELAWTIGEDDEENAAGLRLVKDVRLKGFSKPRC